MFYPFTLYAYAELLRLKKLLKSSAQGAINRRKARNGLWNRPLAVLHLFQNWKKTSSLKTQSPASAVSPTLPTPVTWTRGFNVSWQHPPWSNTSRNATSQRAANRRLGTRPQNLKMPSSVRTTVEKLQNHQNQNRTIADILLSAIQIIPPFEFPVPTTYGASK